MLDMGLMSVLWCHISANELRAELFDVAGLIITGSCYWFLLLVTGELAACNITTCPIASCKWIRQKTANGQAEQDPNLPRSAINALGRV